MKNKTELTKEVIMKSDEILFRFCFTKTIIIYEIIAAIMVCFLVFLESYFLSILFTVFMIGFPFVLSNLYKKKTKETISKILTQNKEIFYTYDFNEETITITIFIDDKSKQTVIENKKLYKVVEDSNYIYLFTDKSSLYALTKNGFEKSFDELEFRSLFVGKTNYKII